MSSEFSCDYCSACPRHPCHSTQEAARCPNQSNPALYLEFDSGEVAMWLREQAKWKDDSGAAALVRAADVLDGV